MKGPKKKKVEAKTDKNKKQNQVKNGIGKEKSKTEIHYKGLKVLEAK